MVNILNMQDLRYIKLFNQVTRVDTKYCFKYNEAIIFAVPKNFVAKAVGEGGKNIKKISLILRKKIKVIAIPKDITEIKGFIESIVNPVTFKGVEVLENEIVLTAGNQSKAALLGRNKRRLKEMQEIIKNFFDKEFKIV